jgi:hypothetical protein
MGWGRGFQLGKRPEKDRAEDGPALPTLRRAGASSPRSSKHKRFGADRAEDGPALPALRGAGASSPRSSNYKGVALCRFT